MLKLQVVLVPPSALKKERQRLAPANGYQNSIINSSPNLLGRELGTSTPNTNNNNTQLFQNSSFYAVEEPALRKFLHITQKSKNLLEVAHEIMLRFEKLYPDEEPLEILKLQDSQSCDLDPDYKAGEVFDYDNVVRVLLSNEIATDIPVTNSSETPQVHNGHGKRPASQIFSSLIVPKKRQKDNRSSIWKSDETRRSTPLSNQVYPDENDGNETKGNESIRNISINAEDSAELSLPPPEDDDTRYLDPKKSKSTVAASPLPPSSKRITSGMLVAPEPQLKDAEEAVLEEKQINEEITQRIIPVKKSIEEKTLEKISLTPSRKTSEESISVSKTLEMPSEEPILPPPSTEKPLPPLKVSAKPSEDTSKAHNTSASDILSKDNVTSKDGFSDSDDDNEVEFTKDEIFKIFKGNGRLPASVKKKFEMQNLNKPIPPKEVRAAARKAAEKMSIPIGPSTSTSVSTSESSSNASSGSSSSGSSEVSSEDSNSRESSASLSQDEKVEKGKEEEVAPLKQKDADGDHVMADATATKQPVAAKPSTSQKQVETPVKRAAETNKTKEDEADLSLTQTLEKPEFQSTQIDSTPSATGKPKAKTAATPKSVKKTVGRVSPENLPLDIPFEEVPGLEELHEKLRNPKLTDAEYEEILNERKKLVYNARRRYKRKIAREQKEVQASSQAEANAPSTSSTTVPKEPVEEIKKTAEKSIQLSQESVEQSSLSIPKVDPNSAAAAEARRLYEQAKIDLAKKQEALSAKAKKFEAETNASRNKLKAPKFVDARSSQPKSEEFVNSSGSDSDSDSDSAEDTDSDDDDEEDDEKDKKRPRIVNTPKGFSQPTTKNEDLRKAIAANKLTEVPEIASAPTTPAGKHATETPSKAPSEAKKGDQATKKPNSRYSLSSLSDLVSRGVPDVLDSLTPKSLRNPREAPEKKKEEEAEDSDTDDSSEESTDDSDSDDSSEASSSDEELKKAYLNAKKAKTLLRNEKSRPRTSSAFKGLMKDAKKK